MKFVAFFICLISLTCMAQELYKYQDVSTMLLEEKPFTKEELFKSFEGKKITNVEEFVAALPESIRKNYVLIYESKSLQSASFKRQRVVLRSPLSEVMLTFSDPQGSTNDHDSNVELMFWEPKEKAFKMQEITFNKSGHKVSEVNPSGCIKCHGNDPRPNWEPYSTWPGVYGGNAEFRFGGELVKGERKYLDAFVASAPKHPIYKNLIGLKQNFKIEKSFTGGEESKGLMSYKLTETLTKLNFQRIVRMMKANPNYEKFKYATLYTAACSDRFGTKSPYPDSLKELNHFVNKTGSTDIIELYQALGTDTSKWSMSFRGLDDKTIRLATPDGQMQNLVYVLLIEDKEVVPYFSKADPLEWEKNTFWEYGEKEILCEKLNEKSQEVLKGINTETVCPEVQFDALNELSKNVEVVVTQIPKGDANKGKKAVLKNCMECHSGAINGLEFFENEEAIKNHLINNPKFIQTLTNRLKAEINPMPPGKSLPESERADIVEYLKSFNSK